MLRVIQATGKRTVDPVMDQLNANEPVWRKSSYSNNSGCVEIARLENHVLIRDSKDQSGPVLQFTLPEWRAFLNGVADGEFEIA
jgi:Domain of unknown function (DUF397)